MADCDMCGEFEGKHRTGRRKICHRCMHDMQIGHNHTGSMLTAVDHAELDGVELKDHLALYLDEERND